VTLVLDAGWKSTVELMLECVVIPTGECRESIKLNDILGQYGEFGFMDRFFEFGFGFTDHVRSSEVSVQL